MLITDLLKKESVTDQEIMESSYGVANFTFDTIPTQEETDRLRSMRRWLEAIGAMKKQALRERVRHGMSTVMKLADCGHYVLHAMSTSHGSSCPDCYDRMSD